MRKHLFVALLLLFCGPASQIVLASSQAELTQLWRIGRDDRVIGFDGRELSQRPLPDGEMPRNATFEQLVLGVQPYEEHQPERDPFLPEAHRAEPLEMPVDLQQPDRKFEPSFVASDLCGMIVFAVGLIGWIALGIAVVIVGSPLSPPEEERGRG